MAMNDTITKPSDAVLRQLRTVRDSGQANMASQVLVLDVASAMGLGELTEWLTQARPRYMVEEYMAAVQAMGELADEAPADE